MRFDFLNITVRHEIGKRYIKTVNTEKEAKNKPPVSKPPQTEAVQEQKAACLTHKTLSKEISVSKEETDINDIEDWIDRHLTISTIILGPAVASIWLPPLGIASAIGLAYLTYPIFQMFVALRRLGTFVPLRLCAFA